MPSRSRSPHDARKIAQRLAAAYPDAGCSLDFKTPLQLLVATILSAQCTDVRVNQVTPALFRKYRTAKDFALAMLPVLERSIQSTGFFRAKAKSIQGACQLLVQQHGGDVPKDLEQLVKLPGVGRKTANVVLGTAFGVAAGVVVDTHVTRVSRRLGLTTAKDAGRIEQDLMAQFDEKDWIKLSHEMIYHGRACCTARRPKCEQCPLNSLCPRIGVES